MTHVGFRAHVKIASRIVSYEPHIGWEPGSLGKRGNFGGAPSSWYVYLEGVYEDLEPG